MFMFASSSFSDNVEDESSKSLFLIYELLFWFVILSELYEKDDEYEDELLFSSKESDIVDELNESSLFLLIESIKDENDDE